MASTTRTVARVIVPLTLVATLLAPGWINPSRTIAIPLTRAAATAGGPAGTRAFSFAPTHVAFSWSGGDGGRILYRTRAGSVWTRWRTAGEAHDLARGRRHYSGVLWVDRPDSVQWRSRGSVDQVTLDYLNTVDGPRRTVSLPATAGAVARAPGIVSRTEWGADESLTRTSGACERAHYPVQQLFVHHTAGRNHDPHPRATMRAILYYHVVRRGWCDIGYNFVISPRGRVFEGRAARAYDPWELHDGEDRSARVVTGAHVLEFNSGSVGISLMGNYSTARLPRRARQALVGLLAWEADRHNLKPRGRHVYRNPATPVVRRLFVIAGHRDAGQTACPGGNVYRALPRIRRQVAAVIGAGKPLSRLRLGSLATPVVFGNEAVVTGRLSTRRGDPLAGRVVQLWRRPALRKWSRADSVATGPAGRFAWRLRPRRNTALAAVFSGGARAWGDDSPKVRVRVAPRITLEPQGGAQDSAGVYHYPSGTESVELSGALLPPHPRSKLFLRISEVTDAGPQLLTVHELRLDASGEFRAEVSLPHPEAGGVFTARARWWGDADHAPGSSPRSRIAVDPP